MNGKAIITGAQVFKKERTYPTLREHIRRGARHEQ